MAILVFVVGEVLGSFLNVCIYRLPRSRSLVHPGSACPHCRKKICWHDNIPLLSFLLLRGCCRFCRHPIGIRYFLVELITSVLLLLLYLHFALSPAFFIFGLFVLGLILVAFIDWEHYLIPDLVVYPGIALGLLFNFLFPEIAPAPGAPTALLDSVAGVLVGGGALYLIAVVGRILYKKDAMGGGDVKLLAMVGAFLGWRAVLLTIFFSSLSGSVVSILLIMAGVKKRTDYIPFGPYLALGAAAAVFFRGYQFLGYYYI